MAVSCGTNDELKQKEEFPVIKYSNLQDYPFYCYECERTFEDKWISITSFVKPYVNDGNPFKYILRFSIKTNYENDFQGTQIRQYYNNGNLSIHCTDNSGAYVAANYFTANYIFNHHLIMLTDNMGYSGYYDPQGNPLAPPPPSDPYSYLGTPISENPLFGSMAEYSRNGDTLTIGNIKFINLGLLRLNQN
ncbi:hypothetical protein FACS1894180_5120 [Bacteroidia bacterium]|nr:hypothetical protein FACS1894180_5120 [Bacteroidia bacterium]